MRTTPIDAEHIKHIYKDDYFTSSLKNSLKKDKDYHDIIFADQVYNPFCASYPGNITIIPFADLIVQRKTLDCWD